MEAGDRLRERRSTPGERDERGKGSGGRDRGRGARRQHERCDDASADGGYQNDHVDERLDQHAEPSTRLRSGSRLRSKHGRRQHGERGEAREDVRDELAPARLEEPEDREHPDQKKAEERSVGAARPPVRSPPECYERARSPRQETEQEKRKVPVERPRMLVAGDAGDVFLDQVERQKVGLGPLRKPKPRHDEQEKHRAESPKDAVERPSRRSEPKRVGADRDPGEKNRGRTFRQRREREAQPEDGVSERAADLARLDQQIGEQRDRERGRERDVGNERVRQREIEEARRQDRECENANLRAEDCGGGVARRDGADRGRERRYDAGSELAQAEQVKRTGSEPIQQRRLLQIGDSVEPRHDPVGRVEHLAGDLRVPTLIGVDEWELIATPDERSGHRHRRERQAEARRSRRPHVQAAARVRNHA